VVDGSGLNHAPYSPLEQIAAHSVDIQNMRAIFSPLWVRQLIGQARDLYTPGLRVRGSPHPNDSATDRSALRIHSDLLSEAFSMAALIRRYSSFEKRAWTRISRNLAFGTFGLPIFLLIKILRMTKIVLDQVSFASYA
jgi:hypothetical protein